MKRLLLLAMVMVLPVNVAYAKDKSAEEGFWGKVKNAVEKVLGGKKEGDKTGGKGEASGNENAVNQIEKNLEKHGGEHKGLENAREAVSKNKAQERYEVQERERHEIKEKHKGDDGSYTEEDMIDDVVEELDKEMGKAKDDDMFSKGDAGKSMHKGKGKGKGR